MRPDDELVTLRTENAGLRAQLAAALARIAELEQQRRDPPAFVEPNSPPRTQPNPPRKKRERRHNHARRRELPTRTIEHALERCPECDYQLRGSSFDYSRQVIELPPAPPVEIIEHRVLK